MKGFMVFSVGLALVLLIGLVDVFLFAGTNVQAQTERLQSRNSHSGFSHSGFSHSGFSQSRYSRSNYRNTQLSRSPGLHEWMYGTGRHPLFSYNFTAEKYLKAAERGDAPAQFNLALMYDRGLGVPQDYAVALKWLRKAAEQGFIEAEFNLGNMYDNGLGVSSDNAQAVKWFRKAAEQGYASAQKNLGAKYGMGQGVPQSYPEAYVWSSVAVMSGNEGAINNRDIAARQLSPDELGVAQLNAAMMFEEIQTRKAVEE